MKYNNTITSIAIGSFDGLHLGHQALIKQVEALIIIERNSGYLTPGYRRSDHTDKLCFFYHFDKIKELAPEGFVARLREDFPLLEKIVVGYDFHFGKAKSGNAAMLKALFPGEVIVVEQVTHENTAVHSRMIKQYLREGDVKKANALLGREYLMEGEPICGQGLGKKELFPTINLFVDHYQLPLEGVYATRTKVDGSWHPSVSFLGHRVSTDGTYAVETHLLDRTIEEVDRFVEVAFVGFIRPNQKFESLEALKMQIAEDIQKAKEILDER